MLVAAGRFVADIGRGTPPDPRTMRFTVVLALVPKKPMVPVMVTT